MELKGNKIMKDNLFEDMEFGYLNALLATVVGTDNQSQQAKEYLKKVDPNWSD